MLKVSGHGSIRKIKGGAAGIITLSALFLGLQGVSADEVTSTSTTEPTTELSSSTDKGEVSKEETKVEGKKVEEKTEVKSDVVPTETSAETKEKVKASEKEVPKDTDKETFTKAESKEFDIAKKDAKDNGVFVKEDTKPSIKDSEEDAQEDLAKQTNDLKAAQKTQVGSEAITSLDKEKLTEAGIKVKDGKVELFTDLEKMAAFVKQQSKGIAKDIESKHGIDKDVTLATKELTDAGIEVVVGAEVVKSSPDEALKAVAELQTQVASALKTKQELDSAFLALQERAKAAGLLTKEGKTVTLESAKDAKEFLAKQTEEVNALIKSLTEGNKQVRDAVAKAESYGVKVTTTEGTKVDTVENLTKLVSAQVSKFDTLIKSIEESKGLIESTVEKAKQAGVSLEGETVVNLAKGEETSLKEKVASALKELDAATQAQTSTKSEFDKLVSDARAKGLTVNVTGSKRVEVSGVSKELEAVKTKIAQALANKDKAQADYETALKNSQEASRLAEGSTAKKEGNVYKQTLTINSNGTKGSVNIKATGSAEIVSVELVDPTGKKVESVKTLSDLTTYTDFSKVGNYTVNYTFRAKDDGTGSVVSSANTQGVAVVEGKASGTLSVTTKADSSTITQYAKRRIIMVLDRSSSFSDERGQKYVNELADKVIDSMNPGDELALVGSENTLNILYPTQVHNYSDFSSDKEALKKAVREVGGNQKIMERIGSNNDATSWRTWINSKSIKDAFSFKGFTEKDVTIVSLLDDTAVDTPDSSTYLQFKQFKDAGGKILAYIPNVAGSSSSERIFKQAGVEDSNIEYVQYANQDPTPVADKIVKSLTSKTVIKVKGEDQLVTVSITGTKTAKVTKATLKGATNKDLPIKDGKVDFSEKLPDGTWIVDYELSGDGDVTVTATVAGKEVVKETKSLKEVKGAEGTSATKTDNIKELVVPNRPSTAPISVEELVVTAKSVRLGTVESDATTVTVEKELNKATFKETVSPITFEREVVPTQAEVTTHDVYVKTPKPQPEGKTLPKTGESSDISVQVAGAGIGLVGLLALAGASKRSRKED